MSIGGHLFGAAILLAAVALVAPRLRAPEPPSEPAPSRPTPFVGHEEMGQLSVAGESYEIDRGPDGHFYVEARVNGARTRFIVDTGASVVALTPADAQRAGLVVGSQRVAARGAGGEIAVAPVTIDRLELGPVAGRDVRAVVAEDLPVSLLGQTFLSRLDRIEIEGDRMILR